MNGLRRSEICGLRWCDVDFTQNQVYICHTAVPRGGKTLYDDHTKTPTSTRLLPLNDTVRAILLTERERQEKYTAMMGCAYQGSGYVCVWEDGHAIQPNYITHMFGKILKQAQKHGSTLPLYRFHDLRHTAASLMLRNHVDLKTIQEWLGHSSMDVTAKIYLHSNMESKKIAATAMETLLA